SANQHREYVAPAPEHEISDPSIKLMDGAVRGARAFRKHQDVAPGRQLVECVIEGLQLRPSPIEWNKRGEIRGQEASGRRVEEIVFRRKPYQMVFAHGPHCVAD